MNKEQIVEILRRKDLRNYRLMTSSSYEQLAGEIMALNKHREQHTMSDYCRPEMKESKFIQGKAIVAYIVFRCPVCGHERTRPEHGDKWTCKCGTNYQTHGNGLEIW